MSLEDLEETERVGRLASYLAVGASGALLDLGVTLTLLEHMGLGILVANTVGFLLANFWNWNLNRRITWSPTDSPVRTYLLYLLWHSLSFAARVGLITLLTLAAVPPLEATLSGIFLASLINFEASERIYTPSRRGDLLRLVNRLAHIVDKRVGERLERLGIRPVAYAFYCRLIAAAHRRDSREVEVGGAQATVGTRTGEEAVSVLHSLHKEEEVARRFLERISPGEVVVDVGANIGLYSLLAASKGAQVLAVEPHNDTAIALERNARLSGVSHRVEVKRYALASEEGEGFLALERDQPGTQTGSLESHLQVVEARRGISSSEPVKIVAGDDMIRYGIAEGEITAPPSHIKIDVEGGELDVLLGLRRVLSPEQHGEYVDQVLVEIHHSGLEQRCREILEAAGLAVRRFETGGSVYLEGLRP